MIKHRAQNKFGTVPRHVDRPEKFLLAQVSSLVSQNAKKQPSNYLNLQALQANLHPVKKDDFCPETNWYSNGLCIIVTT